MPKNTKVPAKPRRASDVKLGVLASSAGYRLRRAELRAFAELVDALAPMDLRPGQFSVLAVVAANAGLRQSDVAGELGIKRANFVPVIDDLELRGLVTRTSSTVDRRANCLHLTPAGERLLARAAKRHAALEQRLAGRLGIERYAQLLALLAEMAE